MTVNILGTRPAEGTSSGLAPSSSPESGRLRKVFIPIVISGTILTASFGTSGAPAAPASEVVSAARAYFRDIERITRGRAGPKPEALQEFSESGTVAESVRDIKNRSGLTWGEFAAAIGVSARAVHLWVSGTSTISAANVARLEELAQLIRANSAASPRVTRERLVIPDATGRSALSKFRDSGGPARSVKLSYLSVADVLEDDGPMAEPVVYEPTRTALARVHKIRKRGAADE